MSEEDIKMILKLVKSINIKLDKLVNLETKEMAKEIVETLKQEDKTNPIDSGKVYNFKKKDGTPLTCNQCKGYISWDLRPERSYPLHVDLEGHILGTGDCPNYEGGN